MTVAQAVWKDERVFARGRWFRACVLSLALTLSGAVVPDDVRAEEPPKLRVVVRPPIRKSRPKPAPHAAAPPRSVQAAPVAEGQPARLLARRNVFAVVLVVGGGAPDP